MAEIIEESSMLSVGTVLKNTYRIERHLSSGGFGNTYIATTIEFGDIVAIKEFYISGINGRDNYSRTVTVSNTNKPFFSGQLEKFKKEARRLRSINHDNIVRVHDLFEENGTAYYVMDYIEGESFADLIKRTNRPIGENDAINYFMQVLDALEAVHAMGILHLDLKPGNIMLDNNGRVKLIDFGASKQQSKGDSTAATSSAVAYTDGYAPREQMEQNLEKFGPWTDIYALGATLYSILTTNLPPMPTDIDDDETPDKIRALPMPYVSDNVRKLILWMMETNRNIRPKSISRIRLFIERMKVMNARMANLYPIQGEMQFEHNQMVNNAVMESIPAPMVNSFPIQEEMQYEQNYIEDGVDDEQILTPVIYEQEHAQVLDVQIQNPNDKEQERTQSDNTPQEVQQLEEEEDNSKSKYEIIGFALLAACLAVGLLFGTDIFFNSDEEETEEIGYSVENANPKTATSNSSSLLNGKKAPSAAATSKSMPKSSQNASNSTTGKNSGSKSLGSKNVVVEKKKEKPVVGNTKEKAVEVVDDAKAKANEAIDKAKREANKALDMKEAPQKNVFKRPANPTPPPAPTEKRRNHGDYMDDIVKLNGLQNQSFSMSIRS